MSQGLIGPSASPILPGLGGFVSSGQGTIMSQGVSAAQGLRGSFFAPVPTVSKVQIQKIKPPIFDGDICNYPAWKKRWKELISPGSDSEC